MASSLTRNQVPRKGLRVRVPCPPLGRNDTRQTLRWNVNGKEAPASRSGAIVLPIQTLRKQGGDGFGLDQLARLVEVVHDHRLGVDAETVIDRGE